MHTYFRRSILHSILLVITVVEKWTKPEHLHMALPTDAQPQHPPPIVVQFMPICPACHNNMDIGADENSHQATVGDSQPQGVAPAHLAQQNEVMFSKESQQEHDFNGPNDRAVI
jgi:hypothetical protein